MTDKTDREIMQQALYALDSKHDMTKAEWRYLQYRAFNDLRERLEKPEQKPVDTCTWTHDDDEGSWDAECGERWSITEGTPEENNFRFCPGCGRKVKTIFATPQK